MSKQTIWINGKWLPEDKAGIPVSDSSYLYGHGAFETIKSVRGKPLFLNDHMKRLRRNVMILKLKFPYSNPQIQKMIEEGLKKNGLKDGVVRLTLSEMPDGKPHLVLLFKEFEPFPQTVYTKGGKLILVRSVKADNIGLASVKSTSYLTRMLARKEIQKRNAVEGVLVNEKGFVTEGGSSNVFRLKDGTLTTPPLSDGLLPGTRRSLILRLAQQLRIPVVEQSMTPRQLMESDEIFVASSLKDILPIGEFEGQRIGKTCPGPLTSKLIQAYSRWTV